MDTIAKQPNDARKELFKETASQLNLTDIIIEKDFWVCWTLKRLYTCPELAPFLTFKGGTSLSKAYNLIERFSEDIDLTINRSAPLLSECPDIMEKGISNKEKYRRIATLKETAQAFVKDIALPNIYKAIKQEFGTDADWHVVLDENDPDHQTILFYYPKVFEYQTFVAGITRPIARPIVQPIVKPLVQGNWKDGYIQPHIKLEFGARGDIEPNETHKIKPYVSDTFPDLLKEPEVSVNVLASERTFWEKATILHALHHGSKLKDRMSRHYYDTYVLSKAGVAEASLKLPELLASVVQNKSLMFKDNKASYKTAVFPTLKLIPTNEDVKILKQDYEKMSEMFLSDYPDFDTVIAELSSLEEKINNL